MRPPKGETITAKQRLWIKHVIDGCSDVVAYEKAYGCLRKTAETNATRLRSNEGVRRELKRAREASFSDMVASEAERKAILTRGLRGEFGDELRIIDSIKELNKMEGSYEPEKVEISGVGSLVELIRKSSEEAQA